MNISKKKKNKGLKALMIVISALATISIVGSLYIAYNPQTVIGIIQNAMYTDNKEINPHEPLNTPSKKVKENGILYVNDVKYGDTYPNSYLDISYPNEDTSINRPTIVYFHGGGFFGGDKALGDPLAVNDDANYLFDKLVLDDFNLVNVNYVLVPEFHFPDPVIQMNEAINYLIDNQEELGLNMEDVVIFGQSAGAIMAAQYGAILSNEEYKNSYKLTEEPKLELTNIRGLIIDDAPLDIPNFESLKLKLLIGNYLNDSIFFDDKELAKQYNPLNYLTKDYPRSFTTSGTDDGFPKDMKKLSDELTKLGVENINFEPPKDKYGLTKHGYLSNLKYDESGAAQDCYDRIIRFLSKTTE